MNLPSLTRAQAMEFLKNHFPLWYPPEYAITTFGIRGYFDPEHNKRGIYDDAIGYISGGSYGIFPANCDPSVSKPEIAVLQPGIWRYKKGLHGIHHLNPEKDDTPAQMVDKAQKLKDLNATGKDISGYTACYYALRQAGDVTVIRDGHTQPYTDTPPRPRMYIDIHRGGYNTTSSEGCQTIHPDYWNAFFWQGVEPLIRDGRTILYCLADAAVPIQKAA